MIEINGLNERIANLKMQYQEAERINLKNKAGELLVDINYLEELRELRNKQELFIKAFDKIRAEIDKARFIDKDTRIVKNALASGLEVAMQIIDKYKAESEVKANGNEK